MNSDWSGIPTPSLTGYTFNPPSITYMHVVMDSPNQNYVGSGPVTAVPVPATNSSRKVP